MMKYILFILVFIFSCNQKPKDILTLSISSSDAIYTKNSQLSLSCELNDIGFCLNIGRSLLPTPSSGL